MIDLDMFTSSKQLLFYMDASAGKELDFGCIFDNRWTYGKWKKGFIEDDKPSSEFLELYALCAGILTWEAILSHCRIIIHCDNKAVVGRVNKLTSSCKKCMLLLRILTLNNLTYNRTVSVVYIKSVDNKLSDALSRLDFKRFRREGLQMNVNPDRKNPIIQDHQKLYNLGINL